MSKNPKIEGIAFRYGDDDYSFWMPDISKDENEKFVQTLFVAQDIDPLVCKMCYIQMCCIGVPGVVVVGNSLFPDAERAPTDFWFTHKYFALDEKALENTYQKTGIYGI